MNFIEAECAQCTDFLDTIDFRGEHVCPICFRYATHKRDEAIKILNRIYPMLTDKNSGIKSEIKRILDMREF